VLSHAVTLWRDPKARLILIANFLLVVGSGITFIAVPWLLVHKPNGEAIFGWANTCLTLLIFLLLPYLGKAIDRTSRKLVLLSYFWFVIGLNLLVILTMPATGGVQTWQLLTVYCLGSLGHSVYYPAQFAFNQEILAREQYEALSGAIEVQWQAGAMVAGGLAALLVERVSLTSILLIDTSMFVAAFILISLIPYRMGAHLQTASASAWRTMLEGLNYLRQRPRLSVIVFCSFVPFLALMVANYLNPIFVKNELRAGAEIYGLGEITYAIGAVLAGLFVPLINRRCGLVPTLLITVAIFALASAAIPTFPTTTVFLIAFMVQGLGNAGSRVARSILVLQTVPNELVGRITLFYSALERLLRSIFLAIATAQVATMGTKPGYWLTVAITLAAWFAIVAARKVRTHQVEQKPQTEAVVS
jgi:MFS family permease